MIIHFHTSDFKDLKSVEELNQCLLDIKTKDKKIKICLLIRDCVSNKKLNLNEYPKQLSDESKNLVDVVIKLQDLNNDS